MMHDDAFTQITSKQHTVMGMNQQNCRSVRCGETPA